ncbi:MAG: PEP/pyruvate-binding domain-containing protein [Anaerolineaceae bacterium]|nr:PEP/pyruvate-binding domain-containing protein [Anaerolineaceae bacterium]
MFPTSASSTRFLKILLALGDYPILGKRIREAMRRELFDRDIISPRIFEARVREMALRSQEREGLVDPYSEENNELWDVRMERIRDHLTTLTFSQNMSFEMFEELLNEVLCKESGVPVGDLSLNINFELAPMELVFEFVNHVESLGPVERAQYAARYEEAKVVLIRTLISDQLRYIKIARQYFTVKDLAYIREHKIGAGRIGGKAAGMLLAAAIMSCSKGRELAESFQIPKSFFVGSGELYTFITFNDLEIWNTQKYKSEEEMRKDYPKIVKEFEKGWMPDDILSKLRQVLEATEHKPLIVRSSSLLEDNFGTSFAGKYESIFLPNQGSLGENLKALVKAMGKIYASTMNPAALLYRRSKDLIDYDERMALLIQEVEGETFGKYYMPHGAGVAFSRNMYRWHPDIRREDGFIRLVWGLGTRAVDRVGNDYPRLIALSHPLLRPSTNTKEIRRYSQQFIDLIDLEKNEFCTVPIHEVISGQYAPLRFITQLDEGGYFSSLHSNLVGKRKNDLVVTFDDLLQRSSFAARMREMLHVLELRYNSPVDIEFTVHIDQLDDGSTDIQITILQCRPQSYMAIKEVPPIPKDLSKMDTFFSTWFVVPQGYIEKIDTIVYIDPKAYFSLPTLNDRFELGHAIGRVNEVMKDNKYLLSGPGRWGSSNSDLGVPINYGDIVNSEALIEVTGPGIGPAPEPSLGTHFFQDLMEANIYPLAIDLEDERSVFRADWLDKAPNHLIEFSPGDERFLDCLKVIKVEDIRSGSFIRVIMNDEIGQALAFLTDDDEYLIG